MNHKSHLPAAIYVLENKLSEAIAKSDEDKKAYYANRLRKMLIRSLKDATEEQTRSATDRLKMFNRLPF